jgi:signal transduction histidine kinase
VIAGLIIGFVVGVLLCGWAARTLLRRGIARVRAAERRARSSERLAEIGAMTSGLAHEIKNPLSTIGLNAQLLAEGVEELTKSDPDARRRLGNRIGALRREVDRLRGILSDFLEFAGQARLDVRETDLRQLIEELVEFYRPEAERQGVRIRADLGGEAFSARVDPRLLKQAMLNLMINATQAMAAPPGGAGGGDGAGQGGAVRTPGELILRLARVRDEQKQEQARIEVIDTGPGIAPELLARIFEPYFTTKPGGSGLGLPTTRRLIEAHGGLIDVLSEPGRGSLFRILLPVAGPPPVG